MTLPSPIASGSPANGFVNSTSFYSAIWTKINSIIAWAVAFQTFTWVVAPFAAGWGNYSGSGGFQSCQYTKDKLGYVTLRGLAQNSSGSTKTVGSTILTLPAGFRPTSEQGFTQVTTASNGDRIDVTTGGLVTLAGNACINTGFVFLDGIRFYGS